MTCDAVIEKCEREEKYEFVIVNVGSIHVGVERKLHGFLFCLVTNGTNHVWKW